MRLLEVGNKTHSFRAGPPVVRLEFILFEFPYVGSYLFKQVFSAPSTFFTFSGVEVALIRPMSQASLRWRSLGVILGLL